MEQSISSIIGVGLFGEWQICYVHLLDGLVLGKGLVLSI